LRIETTAAGSNIEIETTAAGSNIEIETTAAGSNIEIETTAAGSKGSNILIASAAGSRIDRRIGSNLLI
jgi:hypothetical protein